MGMPLYRRCTSDGCGPSSPALIETTEVGSSATYTAWSRSPPTMHLAPLLTSHTAAPPQPSTPVGDGDLRSFSDVVWCSIACAPFYFAARFSSALVAVRCTRIAIAIGEVLKNRLQLILTKIVLVRFNPVYLDGSPCSLLDALG